MPRVSAQEAFNKGKVRHEAGEWQAAEKWYRWSLYQDPKLYATAYNLAICLRNQNRAPEAAAVLAEALAQSPSDKYAALLFGALGEVYREVGRMEDALTCYGNVLKADPRNLEAMNSRAMVLLKLGRFLEVMLTWGKMVEWIGHPNAGSREAEILGAILNNLGNGWREMGEADAAFKYHQASLHWNPIPAVFSNALLDMAYWVVE
jgi:tetratricopeptide (TPR) repeat protein